MITRIISAVVAIIILLAIWLVWHTDGLIFITMCIGLGCIFEYSRLMFVKVEAPYHLRVTFFILCAMLLIATGLFEAFALPIAAIIAVFFFSMALLSIQRAVDLALVLQISSIAATGFIYCGVFTGLTVHVLSLPNGSVWFFGLLAIVFSGDTLAYFTGRFLGKNKLLEPVSPKKTMEGSVGGLIGSALAGVALGLYFFPTLPLHWLVLTALATGAFAQIGDLFESLLKRVADVKDSGGIMPGHGGFLDRVDGVIFAAPIYYVLAKCLSGWFLI